MGSEMCIRDSVRIAIPVRMKFSGGRTWIGNEQREIDADAKIAKSRARKRLRLAHAALGPALPALAAHRHVVRTAMMPSADYNRFAWAFLAPDIQSAILHGRLSTLAIATLEKLTTIPLNWDVQRRLLG